MALFSKLKRACGSLQTTPLPRRFGRVAMVVGLGLVLAACAAGPDGRPEMGLYPVPAYTGDEHFVWCVPYARDISGVSLRGDADTWWAQAAGRYDRGTRPAPYAVLVLKPTSRLSAGHIGVVTGIIGPRKIRVSHANWGWNSATRGRIYTHMPVLDVSPANDWSAVRFKHPAVDAYGRVYPALGFIYSPKAPDLRIAEARPPAPRLPLPTRTDTPAPPPVAAPAPPNAVTALRLF